MEKGEREFVLCVKFNRSFSRVQYNLSKLTRMSELRVCSSNLVKSFHHMELSLSLFPVCVLPVENVYVVFAHVLDFQPSQTVVERQEVEEKEQTSIEES